MIAAEYIDAARAILSNKGIARTLTGFEEASLRECLYEDFEEDFVRMNRLNERVEESGDEAPELLQDHNERLAAVRSLAIQFSREIGIWKGKSRNVLS